jgi:hypothetical protein
MTEVRNGEKEFPVPKIVDRSISQAELDTRGFERRLTQERVTPLRPPVDDCPWSRWMARHACSSPTISCDNTGHPAPEQCEGCTWVQVREPSYIHARDVTFAVSCQGHRKRAPGTATSWAGRCFGTRPRARSTPFWLEAKWTGCTSFDSCDKDPGSSRLTGRQIAVEAMANSYPFLDGLRSPGEVGRLAGWLASRFEGKQNFRTDGRPTAHWSSPEGRVFVRSGNRQALNRSVTRATESVLHEEWSKMRRAGQSSRPIIKVTSPGSIREAVLPDALIIYTTRVPTGSRTY